jgi:hypothetical protein
VLLFMPTPPTDLGEAGLPLVQVAQMQEEPEGGGESGDMVAPAGLVVPTCDPRSGDLRLTGKRPHSTCERERCSIS